MATKQKEKIESFNDYLATVKHYAGLHKLTADERRLLAKVGGPLFQQGSEAQNKASAVMITAVFNLGYECGQKALAKE